MGRIVGPPLQRHAAAAIESPVREAAPVGVAGEMPRRLARSGLPAGPMSDIAARRMSRGNDVQMFSDSGPTIAALVDDLQRSSGPVMTETYAWRDDGTGKLLADELRRIAGQEHRDVTSIVDFKGTRLWPRGPGHPLVESLSQSGVDVIVRPALWRPGAGGGLFQATNHRKVFLMTVDGKPVAWTGGFNFSSEYDAWHDVMVRLEGPSVEPLARPFIERVEQEGGTPTEAMRDFAARAALSQSGGIVDARAGVAILDNNPLARRWDLTHHYVHEIRTAQEHLWITSPYLSSPLLTDELVAAAGRRTPSGNPLDVRVLVPARLDVRTGRNSTNNPVYEFGRSQYEPLLEAGVQLQEQPEMSHQKLLRADSRVTVSGFNLNHRSLLKDLEVGAVIEDARVGAELEALMREDIGQAVRVGADDLGSLGTRVAQRAIRTLRLRL